ncbi:MAG: hypothetical protein IKU11_06275, partial [Clostridia bacterium]|nr:hypothetical protein [Clostridia bacterium]
AISRDALHFTRVPVNEMVYDGITENNIVKMDVYCHNFAPFFDNNPNCKPNERYKAIGGALPHDGIHAFASEDGIHWHDLHPQGGVISEGVFDSMNVAFYNPETRKYHCFMRYWYDPNRDFKNYEVIYKGMRAIRHCTSDDFIHWSESEENQYAEGHPVDQLYTNATSPLPGAEHILVSFPMRFQEFRKKYDTFPEHGISDAILMTSRDGVFWERTVKDAWLAGSTAPHEWSQRNFITAAGIICRDNRFYFYAEKNYMWENDGLWAYSVPKYRLISAYADGSGGIIQTKQLHFSSDDIYINFRTSAYGYVKLTFRDEADNLIYETGELFGNELSCPIHVDGLTGKTGSIQIELKEAHLYAIGSEM